MKPRADANCDNDGPDHTAAAVNLPSPLALDRLAVDLDAAVHCVLDNRCRKDAQVAERLAAAQRRLHAAGSPAAPFRRLLPLAYREDFDPLLDFLDTADRLFPEAVDPGEVPAGLALP